MTATVRFEWTEGSDCLWLELEVEGKPIRVSLSLAAIKAMQGPEPQAARSYLELFAPDRRVVVREFLKLVRMVTWGGADPRPTLSVADLARPASAPSSTRKGAARNRRR
jgi:hypothetical protein